MGEPLWDIIGRHGGNKYRKAKSKEYSWTDGIEDNGSES